MDPATHPSTATMSQYQQSLKCSAVGQSPTYPSPARSDSELLNYHSDGLGLYGYNIPLSAAGAGNFYPPSPHPTEAWPSQFPSGASPHLTEAHERWQDVYDHNIGVARSPIAWNPSFPFPPTEPVGSTHSPASSDGRVVRNRGSISSSNETSIYSRDGSETTFTPQIKVEPRYEWHSDEESPHYMSGRQPLTVSPDRLSANGTFPYAQAYGSPSMTQFESPAEEEECVDSENATRRPTLRRRNSRREHRSSSMHRTRIRRNPTTPENANYQCSLCGKLFQRSYNHKTHMETHDPARLYPNQCQYQGCDKKFVRKTDLLRHEQSVHIKSRNFRCNACDAHFARKDTLRRHEEDGCPRRFEVKDQDMPRKPGSKPSARSDGLPTRQLDHATETSPIVSLSQSPAVYEHEEFSISRPTIY